MITGAEGPAEGGKRFERERKVRTTLEGLCDEGRVNAKGEALSRGWEFRLGDRSKRSRLSRARGKSRRQKHLKEGGEQGRIRGATEFGKRQGR